MITNPVNPFPYPLSPINNIAPITNRDNATLLREFENLRWWLEKKNIPEINGILGQLWSDFQTGIKNAEDHITATEAQWEVTNNAFVASINALYSGLLANIDNAKNGWQALFDAFMIDVVAQIKTLNDLAFSEIVLDDATLTGAGLRKVFVEKGSVYYDVEDYKHVGDVDDTEAFQRVADLGGVVRVRGREYVVKSVSVTKNLSVIGAPGAVFKRRANADTSATSYWNAGVGMFEVDAPGLTLQFTDFTFDGNAANQTPIEPAGFFIKTYPIVPSDPRETIVRVTRGNFINGTSGYLCLRGDDVRKRFTTTAYIDDCTFAETVYGVGKGDPDTPNALGYTPTYVLVMDYVYLRTLNFRAKWGRPVLTGKYAACAINGTYFGTSYLNSGQATVMMHGTTHVTNLGRSNKKYNDDNEWATNNGIGVIDMYGNADTLYVENLIAFDCENTVVRAKGSLKNYTVIKATLTNCHRGLQVGPSSTGPCQTAVKVGDVVSYGGGIPILEFLGTSTTDMLQSVNIESAQLFDAKTNPENLVAIGSVNLRNANIINIGAMLVNGSPSGAITVRDVLKTTMRSLNIDGAVGEGVRIYSGGSTVIDGFTINACGASGINLFTSPTKVSVRNGKITNTVDYGVQSNSTTTELSIQGVEVDTVGGLSRGFYVASGNAVVIGNKAVNVTTGIMKVAGARVREEHNAWNAAEQYGNAIPASGIWSVGDLLYHVAPVAGGNIGWVCTTAGSPGTWKTFGVIGA